MHWGIPACVQPVADKPGLRRAPITAGDVRMVLDE